MDIYNVQANNVDEDEISLNKSQTISMSAIPQQTFEKLPSIIGSRIFLTEEFLGNFPIIKSLISHFKGAVEKTSAVIEYLVDLDPNRIVPNTLANQTNNNKSIANLDNNILQTSTAGIANSQANLVANPGIANSQANLVANPQQNYLPNPNNIMTSPNNNVIVQNPMMSAPKNLFPINETFLPPPMNINNTTNQNIFIPPPPLNNGGKMIAPPPLNLLLQIESIFLYLSKFKFFSQQKS